MYGRLYPSRYESRSYPSRYEGDGGGNNEVLVTVRLEAKDDVEINIGITWPWHYKQPYRSIYSLSLIEFETLKIYIKTNLTNGFI